jgi:Ca-activated chloride channel family protein
MGGVEQKFDFPATLIDHSPEQSHAFVEKLWAMRRIGEIIDELDLHGKNDELIQELVTLSTKHGILTPYTSFLADENAAPGSVASTETSVRRAAVLVDRLREAEGKAAFAQRAEKQLLQFAEQPMPIASTSAGAAVPMLRNIDNDRAEAVNAVQLVGNQVLYRRGNTWYTYDVARSAATRSLADVKVVERFSDEYFRLLRETTPENQRILASQKDQEEVMIRHPAAAKVYRVK